MDKERTKKTDRQRDRTKVVVQSKNGNWDD
jgi:hypothetical protein